MARRRPVDGGFFASGQIFSAKYLENGLALPAFPTTFNESG
jgi:hypothetical protein